MTATLLASNLVAPFPPAPVVARERAVLAVNGMPRHLRLRVEGLMAEHLSPADLADPLADVWVTPWFTRWRRDPAAPGAAGAAPTVSCREVIEAPAHELATFRSALAELAGTFGFSARLAG